MRYYYQGEVVESVELKGKHTRTDRVLVNLPSGEVRDVPINELQPIGKDRFYDADWQCNSKDASYKHRKL